jgi:glycosyltransferase involved in cell wall biosynthesis
MHGLPVLSLTVDPDGVLTKEKIGLCASGSFDRLVEAAVDLCASPGRRGELGRRAWTYAREHYDLTRSAGQLTALLRSLLGTRTGAMSRKATS